MPVPQPEEVLELANELKEARSRVSELESRWNSFFSKNPEPSQAPSWSGSAVSPYLKPRIIALLEANPNYSYTVQRVSETLGAKENSVGPYLSELASDGKIERRARGLYGANRPESEKPVYLSASDILELNQ